MFLFLKKVVAIVALASLVGNAHAYPEIGPNGSYDFGTLDVSKGVTVTDFSGDFFNTFTFTMGSFPAVQGAFVGLDVSGDMTAQSRFGMGVAPGSYFDGPAWSPEVPVPSDPLSGAFAFYQTFAVSPNQTYWFQLAGTADQAGYTITLAPVPEPESWALLISGLGLMGLVIRRRRNASAV